MDARRDRVGRGIHVPVIRARLRIQHHRHDQHDDVGLARGRRAVRRGAQHPVPVGRRDELGEAGLLVDVRAALVDRGDDRLVDVDGDDLPAVRRELGGERQAHLAGADHRHDPGRSGLAAPRPHGPRERVAARVRLRRDRAAGQVRGARRPVGDRHRAGTSSSSTVRRSRAARSSASATTTAHRPSSALTTGRPPSRTTVKNASSSAASGSPLASGRSTDSPSNVGAYPPIRRGFVVSVERVNVSRWREVVELEHALLADHGQRPALGRRQPVDMEHPDRARRERQQPEQQVLVVLVDALGGLGRDAGRALGRDEREDVDVVRREIDGHADVADARRERAGPPARDRVDRRQPALRPAAGRAPGPPG